MKTFSSFILLALSTLVACGQQQPSSSQSSSEVEQQKAAVQADTSGIEYIDIDVEAFREKMKDPDVVILDVRTPEETALGKIEGAIEMNYLDEHFQEQLDKLDKDKTYLVYCRSGNRSAKASAIMVQKGFKKVYNLKGGYIAWTADK